MEGLHSLNAEGVGDSQQCLGLCSMKQVDEPRRKSQVVVEKNLWKGKTADLSTRRGEAVDLRDFEQVRSKAILRKEAVHVLYPTPFGCLYPFLFPSHDWTVTESAWVQIFG